MEERRWSSVFVATLVALLSLSLVCGGVGIAIAESESPPGEPASFYGAATEADGTEIPAGVRIVAVVNGTVEGEVTVETAGEYGGPGAFDDKLRVDSTAGDEVAFRLVGPNGSIGGNASLEAGVSEKNLTFSDGSVEALPPTPKVDIDPKAVTVGDSIEFSAAESSAHADSEIVAFEWTIDRDDETIETFGGENSTRSLETAGSYDLVLTVTDDGGRTATETATFEVESDGSESYDGESDGGSEGSSGGGGGGGGGSAGGGGGGGGSSSTGTSDGATNTSESTDATESSSTSREPIYTETRRIEDQFPDTPGTAVVFEETSIREIAFENRSVEGNVSIEEFDGPIDEGPPLPGNRSIAATSVITVPDEYRDTDAILRAVVSEEWVSKRGFEAEYLTIYRLPDGGDSWQPLPTEAFEIDGGYLVEAETPGFSRFVIAGREPPSEADSTVEQSDSSPDTTSSKSPVEKDDAPESSEPTTAADTRGFDPSTPIVPLAALFALLVAVATIGRLFIPRRRKKW